MTRRIKRKCKCGCGAITDYKRKFKWINGHWFKHGLRYHNIYQRWLNMKQRCSNQKNPAYKYYGGRGIRVCIRWRRSFISFYNWCMLNGYKEEFDIDRKNNNENYTPSNCRFINRSENCTNRRIRNDNSTGYIGINFDKHHKKYKSRINNKHLGYFNTVKQALMKRNNYITENKLSHKLQ